jgi:hypothetical protein
LDKEEERRRRRRRRKGNRGCELEVGGRSVWLFFVA